MLVKLGIKKLDTITVDNVSSNDVATLIFLYLSSFKLTKRNGLLCDDELFHVLCSAHILNLAYDGIKEVKDSILCLRCM